VNLQAVFSEAIHGMGMARSVQEVHQTWRVVAVGGVDLAAAAAVGQLAGVLGFELHSAMKELNCVVGRGLYGGIEDQFGEHIEDRMHMQDEQDYTER